MGFDYIYSQAKGHTKAWNSHFIREAENLFAAPQGQVSRNFLARAIGHSPLIVGSTVHIRRTNDELLIFDGLTQIAHAESPSLALFELVDASYGVVEGTVFDVIDEANLVRIRVQDGGQSD